MPQFELSFFPSEIFWTLVSFALLFVLLRWLVLPRLTAILNARTSLIEEEIEQAKRQYLEAEQLRLDYQKQLDAASEDARRMFDESEARVRQRHKQLMDEWKVDMKRREAAFREESEMTRQRALREIRAEAADMVVDATEKLIHEHVDAQEAEAMLNEAIAELDSSGANLRKH